MFEELRKHSTSKFGRVEHCKSLSIVGPSDEATQSTSVEHSAKEDL